MITAGRINASSIVLAPCNPKIISSSSRNSSISGKISDKFYTELNSDNIKKFFFVMLLIGAPGFCGYSARLGAVCLVPYYKGFKCSHLFLFTFEDCSCLDFFLPLFLMNSAF